METRIRPAGVKDAFDEALRLLASGDVVGVPTETVYGLAGDATRGEAVARIFEAKGRPSFNPLIAHVDDLAMARRIAVLDDVAEGLAERFWPGPLTMVLPLAEHSPVHPLATAGLPTVAVRMPSGTMRSLVQALGRPLAAPSANRSGRVSPTTALHVKTSLEGRVPLVLDAGPCAVGLESTIVQIAEDAIRLLRPGAVTAENLQHVTGFPVRVGGDGNIVAPGQLSSHYAPSGRVRLDVSHVEAGEYLIAFGPRRIAGEEGAAGRIDLSPSGDLREAASALFAALSQFDDPTITRIAVAPIPHEGLGVAINDRLARAAAPRAREDNR